jgi:4-hydroxy-tetrahydrodipicolinate reductase
MNLLLFGYGKMGQAIERIAVSQGHRIAGVVDPAQGKAFDFSSRPDAAIEFTVPDAAPGNIRQCLDHGVPILCGTTGWLNHYEEVAAYCRERNGTFFYASNYSLGVNLFFRLNEQLARMMSKRPGYDVSIDEVHHTQKKDAPSGTAITLAQGILKHLPFKKQWVKTETRQPEDLVIRSTRVDPTPGTHTVAYRSIEDDLEIRHTAHSREGFARGAVAVAEWLPGKKGVLGMNDFLPASP